MTDFDPAALLRQVQYAWSFRVMLSDIKDFLALSEHTIDWQLLAERQSIRRQAELNSFGFDDNHSADMHRDQLTESAEHRFTVALPMQIRYAAFVALTNTTEWAMRSLQKRWTQPLPTTPMNLRNPEMTASSLLAYFAKSTSLSTTNVVSDYPCLVEVRNAVVHNGGVVNNYRKPNKLKKAVDALNGFHISKWHVWWDECIRIDRGALDPHIDGMSQLLHDIHKIADETGLLRPSGV
jgi:hypothetical protein